MDCSLDSEHILSFKYIFSVILEILQNITTAIQMQRRKQYLGFSPKTAEPKTKKKIKEYSTRSLKFMISSSLHFSWYQVTSPLLKIDDITQILLVTCNFSFCQSFCITLSNPYSPYFPIPKQILCSRLQLK